MSVINISAPPSFKCYQHSLPDMRLVDDGLSTSEDDVWQASTQIGDDNYVLDVGWWPHTKKYVCRLVLNRDWEQPQEVRTFDYPHEVVAWIGGWFKKLTARGAVLPAQE